MAGLTRACKAGVCFPPWWTPIRVKYSSFSVLSSFWTSHDIHSWVASARHSVSRHFLRPSKNSLQEGHFWRCCCCPRFSSWLIQQSNDNHTNNDTATHIQYTTMGGPRGRKSAKVDPAKMEQVRGRQSIVDNDSIAFCVGFYVRASRTESRCP